LARPAQHLVEAIQPANSVCVRRLPLAADKLELVRSAFFVRSFSRLVTAGFIWLPVLGNDLFKLNAQCVTLVHVFHVLRPSIVLQLTKCGI
jgi:hypothetical protein